MAVNKTYSEKLLDPRWQKKRLEILNRDNFTCVKCGDDKNTLHVHHKSYKGEPWDIPSSQLETVCKSCHSKEHKTKNTEPVINHNIDDQGRVMYHKDNPDYPPIYVNGWNCDPIYLTPKKIGELNSNDFGNNRLNAELVWKYNFLQKHRKMSLLDFKKDVKRFVKCSKSEYVKYLKDELHDYCLKFHIVIKDKGGFKFGSDEMNIQYFPKF